MILIPVRQKLPRRALPDVGYAVHLELTKSGIASRLRPGSRIAIGVGSRGIANLKEIVRSVVDFWKSNGMVPFLFPAMGSHGAGTAAGQAEVLARYGIHEATMSCPVVSSFDVVSLGTNSLGVESFVGRDAWNSDGVFLISRVKWHTSFAGAIESGVVKMLAIGLGKLEGARICHAHARRHGMEAVIRSVAERTMQSGKFIGGLAIIEDAYHQTAQITAVVPESLFSREEELLVTAKSLMARIPVPNVDVLVVDEIGKNISGTGMDLKVVNRGAQGQYNPWPNTPVIERVFVRGLSDLSYGNAVGIGLADVVHDRVVEKVDVNAGRINARTSGSLAAVRTPLHFASDRECLDLAASTVGKLDEADVTVVWIRNTLALDTITISENLIEDIRKSPALEIAGPAFAMEFDEAGNLTASGSAVTA